MQTGVNPTAQSELKSEICHLLFHPRLYKSMTCSMALLFKPIRSGVSNPAR